LLHPLADLIVGRSVLNELVKEGFVLPQDAKRLLQIGQLEIVGLHCIDDAGFRDFNLSLLGVGVAFGYCSPQAQFPEYIACRYLIWRG
jgi:hypothetical protein